MRERERAQRAILAMTVNWVAEESKATVTIEENSRLQYLSWYCFLGEMKL